MIDAAQRTGKGKIQQVPGIGSGFGHSTSWMKGGHSPTSFGKSGNLEDFRTNITHLKLFSKEILRLTRDVQFEVICFAVGLIRRHFSS